MGIGPSILSLYIQLREAGIMGPEQSIMELGDQNVWTNKPNIVKRLYSAYGAPPPSEQRVADMIRWKATGRQMYTDLGHKFACMDVAPNAEALKIDLNFDPCPDVHRGKYDLVTNHGTSEHVFDQRNVFQVMHDLTRTSGLMIHAVPFAGQFQHGLVCYQPNFFTALAKANGYRIRHLLVSLDWRSVSLVPWEPSLMRHLRLDESTTMLLVVVLEKQYGTPFSVPLQELYFDDVPDEIFARYTMVVDGELHDGAHYRELRAKTLSKTIDQYRFLELVRVLAGRIPGIVRRALKK